MKNDGYNIVNGITLGLVITIWLIVTYLLGGLGRIESKLDSLIELHQDFKYEEPTESELEAYERASKQYFDAIELGRLAL